MARGFEEAVKVQVDSPTGIKETLNILLMAATKEQRIKSSDTILHNIHPGSFDPYKD